DDERNFRKKRELRQASSDCNRHEPARSANRREIGEPVREANDIERAEAQRKAEQGSKFEWRAKARDKDRKSLPKNSDSPEEQQEPTEAAVRNREVRTPTEEPAQTDDEYPEKENGQDNSEQIKTRVPIANEVSQNTPAQFGNEADLSKETGTGRYVSHESSSN